MSAGPGPRLLSPIVNCRFFPHGLRYNPFPDRVNPFEIVDLVKLRGRRGSFARNWPDLLGSVFRIKCSQLKPIEFRCCRLQREDSMVLQARRWGWAKGHRVWLRAAVMLLSGRDLGRWGTMKHSDRLSPT